MIRKLSLPALLGVALLLLTGTQTARAETPVATDSMSVALAVFIGDVVENALDTHAQMGMQVDRDAFVKYLSDYLQGKPTGLNPAEAKEYLNSQYHKTAASLPTPLPGADPDTEAAFLAAAAAQPGAIVLPSGTVLKVLIEGTGPLPTEDGIAEMRFVGILSNGSVFDEVREDEAALDFPVLGLLPGFTEALLSGKMRSGGKYTLTIPAEAGYGKEGVPGKVPPGATLHFTVDLIDAE